MSSPIFDATFGTGRFKSEEPMTTSDQSQATPASPAPSSEPQDVRGLAMEAADTISRELAELGVRVPDDLREPIASEIRKVIRAVLAQSDAEPVRTAPETCPHCFNEEDCGQIELCSALAKGPQSDAEPKHDVCVTDAMVEAAGKAWLRARLNIGPDGLTEECWSEILSAMHVVLAAALAEAIAAEIRGKPEFKEMIARAEEKPDASGLIGALADDLGLTLRGLIAKYHGPLRSRAADRSVHGDLIPDCPTDGVAARQGNGG